MKTALEAQDVNAIADAQDVLAKLAVEKEKVSMSLASKETKKKEVLNQKPDETKDVSNHNHKYQSKGSKLG